LPQIKSINANSSDLAVSAAQLEFCHRLYSALPIWMPPLPASTPLPISTPPTVTALPQPAA